MERSGAEKRHVSRSQYLLTWQEQDAMLKKYPLSHWRTNHLWLTAGPERAHSTEVLTWC